jgi:hypothetical protein
MSQSRSLPSEWVARLFGRFQAIYGNRVGTMWADADPEEVRRVWGESLGRFDPADIRSALDDVVRGYPDFPPTLPQFLALCMDSMRRRSQETPKLAAPRVPMPPHIREQLDAFVAKSKAKTTFRIDEPGNA